MNNHIKALAATWTAEADALRDGNHPARNNTSRVLLLREEVTLRACTCDLLAALEKQSKTPNRPITNAELGQLQALNNPSQAAPECPDLLTDSGAAFDFRLGFHTARAAMRPLPHQPTPLQLAQADALRALREYDELQASRATMREAANLLRRLIDNINNGPHTFGNLSDDLHRIATYTQPPTP